MTPFVREKLGLIGAYGKDTITGSKGVVSTVAFDLPGCVSLTLVRPERDSKTWFESVWLQDSRFEAHQTLHPADVLTFAESSVDESIATLGYAYRDVVTGFGGISTSVAFDSALNVQLFLTPPIDTTGKMPDGGWFDVVRMERVGDAARVLPLPTHYTHDPIVAKERIDYRRPGGIVKPVQSR
jgi:hypothetical protein